MTSRKFEDRPAVRERVPLWVGLAGPSGGGKTFSALRLATGIKRVTGGEIFVIDTEARRALHYANLFTFRHVPFEAPFSPLDYLEAIEHCVAKKAGVIVIDSCSHEHEGQGGVLEWHDRELEAMGGRASDSFRAWSKPKAARRRLVNAMLQMPANFILCFRAQEKTKPEKGSKELTQLGWMPIAGEAWAYECTAMALLPPRADGVPMWLPERAGEKRMVKLPEQFKALFAESRPLSEDIGEQLAKWAAGDSIAAPAKIIVEDMVLAYQGCASTDELKRLDDARRAGWSSLSEADKKALNDAAKAAKARLVGREAA